MLTQPELRRNYADLIYLVLVIPHSFARENSFGPSYSLYSLIYRRYPFPPLFLIDHFESVLNYLRIFIP